MSWGTYLGGLAFLVLTLGAVGLAAAIILRRRLAHLTGVPRVLAAGVVFTAGVLIAHLVPGVVGLLHREAVLAVALAGLALVFLVRPAPPTEIAPEAPPEQPSATLSWALAAIGGLAMVVAALAFLRDFGTYPVIHGDVLTYNLPTVANWMQHASLWPVRQFEPDLANANYPANGNVITLAGVLPFGNDAFARFPTVAYVPLTTLAVYAMACELRAPRATAALAALTLTACWVVAFAGVRLSFPDSVLLFCFGAGLVFLVRHFRTGRTSELVLAGVALGIAFGTKWYGVTSVGAVLAVWAVGALLARRGLVWVLRNGVILTALCLLSGGFWLLRNAIESGSPFFPAGVKAFGVTVFRSPDNPVFDRLDHTVADYATDARVLREVALDQWWGAYGLPGPVLLVLALLSAGILVAVWRGRLERPPHWGLIRLAAGAALLLALVYAVTPTTAFGPEGRPLLIGVNSRYLVPAAMVAAALGAWAVGRSGRLRLPLEVLLLVGVLGGVKRSFEPSLRGSAQAVAALVLLGALSYALPRIWQRAGRRPSRPVALAAVAGCALALAVAAGYGSQRTFTTHRYIGLDPTFDWVRENAPSGARIGMARIDVLQGVSPVYAMFGPAMENDVDYAGPVIEGMQRRYRTRASFDAAVRRRHYDLLLVGSSTRREDRGTDPGAWARRAGFEPVARSRFLTLLRAPRGG